MICERPIQSGDDGVGDSCLSDFYDGTERVCFLAQVFALEPSKIGDIRHGAYFVGEGRMHVNGKTRTKRN